MKVVINRGWGGFGLSREAFHELRKRGNKCALEETDIGERWGADRPAVRDEWLSSFCSEIERHDPDLIAVLEEMGLEKASGPHANLKIVEIPDGTDYTIDEYNGQESIHETHRSWE